MIVLVIYSGIICVVGKSDNATYREDYIIVLGAGLKGDTPSLALERRLEKAAEYMNKNGNAIAIVSGGQGKGGIGVDAPICVASMPFIFAINSERKT